MFEPTPFYNSISGDIASLSFPISDCNDVLDFLTLNSDETGYIDNLGMSGFYFFHPLSRERVIGALNILQDLHYIDIIKRKGKITIFRLDIYLIKYMAKFIQQLAQCHVIPTFY